MDFPHPSQSAGSLLGGIKDRLGLNKQKDRDDYYDDDAYYDEPYDDYSDDYGPYGSDDYEYTTRPRSHYRGTSAPHLVSAEDVRATTSAFGVAGRESSTLSGQNTSSLSSSSYSYVQQPTSRLGRSHIGDLDVNDLDQPAIEYHDFVSPYQSHDTSNASGSASSSTATSHSTGLDSLFTPTTSTSAGSSTSTTDPYAAYETGSSFSVKAQREFHVIKPVVYQDVQTIARIVRSGDVVVLALRSTNDALAKRVLDFSFGVASALDASVECIADKMFTVAQGKELTLDEKHRARQQAQR